MKPVKLFMCCIIFCVLGLGVTYAHKLPDDASPELRAFTYRDGLLHTISAQMSVMADMARGIRQADDAAFVRAANNLAFLSTIIPDAFSVRAIVEESLAKPEIWDNWDDFVSKANDLTEKAEEIAAVAETEGFIRARGMVRGVGDTCGACHKQYKVKTD